MKNYKTSLQFNILILSFFMIFITSCDDGGGGNTNSAGADNDTTISSLPPDPGEAGKATLAGIDSDNDGVRDDLQRYIELTYPESEKTHTALRQISKTREKAIREADSKEKSRKNSNNLGKGLECLDFIRNGKDNIFINNSLRAQTLNTRERSLAYIKYKGLA